MIKSMTGFAAVTREDERATVAVTIRALNHRYLDLQLRLPQRWRRSRARSARSWAGTSRAAGSS